ncbi:MAG: hypothetical protein EA350_13845 [Gemmatimonadales bacterium]|nr:MAG: hypothetical protein EA350_13845 [Gemmatimonadales bacterium]
MAHPPRSSVFSRARGRWRLGLARRPRFALLPVAAMIAVLVPVLGVTPQALEGQSAQDRIQGLGIENAERYIDPVARGLGLALTAGIFDRATVLPAFHVDLGVRIAASFRSEADRTFDAVLPASFEWDHPATGPRSFQNPLAPVEGSLTTPSAMGEGPGIVVEPAGEFRQALLQAGENPDAYRVAFPAGLDLSLVPAAALYVSMGVGFGTEITLRALPGVRVSPDLGNFSGTGFAVKHEISRWIDSPVDLAVGVGSQNLSVDEFFEASAMEGWLLVGKAVGPLSFYGTGGLRRATVDVEYRVDNPNEIPGLPADGTVVTFQPDLGTRAAWGGGIRLQLLLLNLAGQYNGGENPGFSIKVAFGIP